LSRFWTTNKTIRGAATAGDGNKRVALASALVFLELHGIKAFDRKDQLYELTMGIARSEITKDKTTPWLAELCERPAHDNTQEHDTQ
jgi:prophage maintenance system killer protein